jgi:hypothetical protein
MFPMDAAVIPLPREETTPPVTKTYFDMGDLLAVFQILPERVEDQTSNGRGSPGQPGFARLQHVPHWSPKRAAELTFRQSQQPEGEQGREAAR